MVKILSMRDFQDGKLPANAVYVGRPKAGGYPLHFGNPFTVESAGREQAIEDFCVWRAGIGFKDVEPMRQDWVRRNEILLRGRDLVCWCAPLACHAEVYADASVTAVRPVFRVIVAGSRCEYDPHLEELVFKTLDNALANKVHSHEIVILSGMAKGFDSLAVTYANTRHFHLAEFPAFWELQGKAAGVIRNAEMRKYADAVVCFWDGQSKGTREMIESSLKQGLPLRVIRF